MKKAIFILGAIAVAAACSQEKEMPLAKSTFTIRAEAVQDPATKVSYSEGTEKSGIHWEVGETIGLVPSAGQQVESAGLTSEQRKEDGTKAEFSVTADPGTYTVYHPYNAESADGAICFNISAEQSQGSAGFMDAGTKRLPLIGQAPVDLSADTDFADVKFKTVGTLLRFFVYGGADGEKLKKISVSSGSAALSGKITTSNGDEISVSDGGNTVSVSLGNTAGIPSIAEDAKGVYAVVIPASNAENVTYTVTTDKYIYSFASTAAHMWESGKKYDVYLNLSKNTGLAYSPIEAPDKLYILGNATEAAKWEPGSAFELKKTGDIFEGEFLLYHDKYFRFSNQKSDYTHAYLRNENTGKLEYSGEKVPGDNNFKVTEGTGWYKVTVNFATGEVTAEHLPPYMGGGPCTWERWNDDTRMTQVEPGIFTFEGKVPRSTGTVEFKFAAKKDTYHYAYQVKQGIGQAAACFADIQNGSQAEMVLQYKSEYDNKWVFASRDTGIKYKFTLNTKTMTIQVVPMPVFYIIGKSGEGWSWEIFNNEASKMTSNFDEKKATWTGNLESSVGMEKTFKIHSEMDSNNQDWYASNALWLFSSNSSNGLDAINNGNDGYAKAIENEGQEYPVYKDTMSPDCKWRFKAAASGKNITLTLDWSDWDNMKLSFVVNNTENNE